MGRPKKLNDMLISQLEQVFNGGSTIVDACNYVNISTGSFEQWQSKGDAIFKKVSNNEDAEAALSEDDKLYLQFFRRIKRAQSVMRVEAVALIREAAQNGNWQAAAWLLERSDPRNWGRRVVENEISGEIVVRVVRKKVKHD